MVYMSVGCDDCSLQYLFCYIFFNLWFPATDFYWFIKSERQNL